jgi:hypothetical protein
MADDTAITAYQRKMLRKSELWMERSSWMNHWREISEYQQPRAGRFFVTDRNRGEKRHQSIYDRTAIGAARTLAAGLMSGMTSPARAWFRLKLQDPALMDIGAVKSWLHKTEMLLREMFAASNTYRVLQQGYEELGLFGTWATCVLPDFENVIHCYPMTIGEYAVATNYRGVVDTLCREYEMTVGQMVAQFGKDRVSLTIQNLYSRGSLNTWVPVVHLIEPNHGRDVTKLDAKNMRWASTYMETAQQNSSQFLSESGFPRFPVLAPRWSTTGNDVYGSSPGMEALGDVKQLQHQQLRKSQAIDYQVNPPLQVPVDYKDAAKDRLPGGIMYVNSGGAPTGGVRTAFEVNLDLSHLLVDIQDVRSRIQSAYYEDLFLMLANDTRSGITATEVAERHEEKLLMLGPVLERLHNELLSPLIGLAFHYASDAGILPPIPDELRGKDISPEFISTLAQAQRVVSAQGTDRLLATLGSMSQIWPSVKFKVDPNKIVDDYADNYGVNPDIIVPSPQADQAAAQEQKAMAAQQTAASIPAMAGAVKAAGDTNADGVKDVMNMFQGYGAQQ